MNLRIPGPTPLPKKVLQAAGQQVINHRSREYEIVQKRVVSNLAYFFQTKNDIFLLTSSGMGGLEAAISNFFSPGDTLVFFTCGEFGNRWAEIARRYGAIVRHYKAIEGISVSSELVKKALSENKTIKGVFFTHNETSSGVLNPLSALIPQVREHPSQPLILVDSISALGAVDLPMDRLGIDVLVTASQKAWMAPPGISMIAVSKKAWDFQKKATMPHYYFDLSLYKKFSEKNQTPATCAVSTIVALDTALQLMKKEGRQKIFARHIVLMKYLRKEIKTIGYELFTADMDASPTVTSIRLPQGVDGHTLVSYLKKAYKVELAGGMGETKGKIIRVAHMGYVDKNDLRIVITALKNSFSTVKT